MTNLLEEIGLKRKEYPKKNPLVTVKVTGDLNDADYKIGEACFDLTNEEDIDLLKEFINLYKKYEELFRKY